MMEVEKEQTKSSIDENLYSRQLFIIDHSSMKKVVESDVLIVGLGGAGVEIAKNVILTGVRSVTISDNTLTSHADLAAQFYLSESQVGINRAEASKDKLAELNPYVQVYAHRGELTEEFLAKFTVVVLTETSLAEQERINRFCHNKGIKFVAADTFGVFAGVFVDFGEEFLVIDPTGEPLITYMIEGVTQEGVITVSEEAKLDFRSPYVTFSDLVGAEELNNSAPLKIDNVDKYTFSLAEKLALSPYVKGGRVTEVIVPETKKFLPLYDSLKAPTYQECDFKDFSQRHLAFLAVHEFQTKFSRLPNSYCTQDAIAFVEIAKAINAHNPIADPIDESLLRKFSFVARGKLSPMAAFVGGVVGQEVLKAITGKFTPIHQWLYFDAIEALPEQDLDPAECQPTRSRYDSQIAVFGKHIQQQLEDLHLFLVGAGAIGCEMLKNWAMMGVATRDGLVQVTDMDTIEKSNLNRQFLFRSENIEKLKSETAAAAVQKMNPAMKIKAYAERVGPETEKLFDAQFYSSLFSVVNALDNVEARQYMDQKCVENRLPLLESGTLGTKGNTQVVVPYLTESYGSSTDPRETTIPICTLHHFPSKIEHTIQWARDIFQGLYYNAPEQVNAYLSQPSFLTILQQQNMSTRVETISNVYHALVTDRAISFDHCVAWARLLFETYFNTNIRQLLYNFPEDFITSSGTPFWSGAKRAPHPIQFDPENKLHMDFIIAAANIRARNYGLKGSDDVEYYKSILDDVIVPDFSPKNVYIPANENEAKEAASKRVDSGDQEETKLNNMLKELPAPTSLAGFKLLPIEFEKDDDTNYHIDFITACSNLRASNYTIPLADRHKTKGIAGKIIPAMVTTTAMITGLVCLELYKLIQKKKIDAYKNSFVNLALPFFSFSEPLEPAKTKIRDGWEWSLWDRIDFTGPLTLGQIVQEYEDKYGLEVSLLSGESSILHGFYLKPNVINERKNIELSKVLESVTKKPAPNPITLVALCSRIEDGVEVDVPSGLYKY